MEHMISEQDLKNHLQCMGPKLFKKTFITDKRMTGRSTRYALRYINEALGNPGKNVVVSDHHGTHRANLMLYSTVIAMVNKLNLRGFNFPKENTIMFSLYETEPKTILKGIKNAKS